ncbi:40S ribosomal protein SA-like [Arachis duranensis]|uniref:Small ribosomal subunit protein uS2 n=1 Tax=Arachis duranensis TaxID=130453 RepID=A0A9C6WL24_ARADU|nr:40S ribosomal protein SA-like [Arachis duranensis]
MATSAATTAEVSHQLSRKEQDIQMMLVAEVHLESKNCDFQMERYVFKRCNDCIYIINLGKTWENLQLATRIIVAIENPHDIIVQSARPYGQRAVLKFAQYTGANAIAGRHTPGTFTNQMQTSYNEPRLLILTDPMTDHQMRGTIRPGLKWDVMRIKEGALGNIPTIAFCDTDSPMRYVDVTIPANNKGKHSIGCLFWLLARMVLQMRGTIRPGLKWDVMNNLSCSTYRCKKFGESEEAKQQEEEELPTAPVYAIQDFGATGMAGFPAADGEWGAVTAEQSWTEPVPQQPIAAAPANLAPDAAAGDWKPVPAPQASVPASIGVAPTGWE